MATHCSILAWKIPWTNRAMRSQNVWHSWVTEHTHSVTKHTKFSNLPNFTKIAIDEARFKSRWENLLFNSLIHIFQSSDMFGPIVCQFYPLFLVKSKCKLFRNPFVHTYLFWSLCMCYGDSFLINEY